MKTLTKAWVAVPLTAVLLSFGATAPAFAQAGGLVAVNVGPVLLNEILSDINVNVSDINLPIQVPIGIAANVCNVRIDAEISDAVCWNEQGEMPSVWGSQMHHLFLRLSLAPPC
jgi:hypothetical protein